MTKPCDLDSKVQDPYETCSYCGALPLARCRGEDLSEIAEQRLRARMAKLSKQEV
jgi:hypothetical protein